MPSCHELTLQKMREDGSVIRKHIEKHNYERCNPDDKYIVHLVRDKAFSEKVIKGVPGERDKFTGKRDK